ncbi:hypothetical protein KIF24_11490 [Micromonospora sp. Llam7]|uniref:hypothetical protein n=1 Tax=Micromonospora tarapacensis TaxID=2835305 RepID=UPI001C838579|nr:hypothetical protein [Micromonospora tarapacensis]MBX7266601.1 hypothetical protein [Micromonospora tarapacensis]
MPFAEDYEAAATMLDAAAQMTGTLMEPARAAIGAGSMIGGQLTNIVTDELDAAAAILDQVATELTQLAVTCRERAETCRAAVAAERDYTAAYEEYRTELRDWQEHREPGRLPEAPQPPAAPPSWANH